VASSRNRKTTIAKRDRERRLLERRAAKQAKKDAKKRAVDVEGGGADPTAVHDVEADSAPRAVRDQGDGAPMDDRRRA
jgi:hypothetical protein